MNCPSCGKEVIPDSFFCSWCDVFIPSPSKGKKANLFTRLMAWAMDLLFVILAFVVWLIVANIILVINGKSSYGPHDGGGGFPILIMFLVFAAYLIWFLSLLRKGTTPGKKLLKIQVVNQQSGDIPGFQKMFLREIVGRILSGLFFGLGYIWALLDKNGQAWHDKLAGTVVVKLDH